MKVYGMIVHSSAGQHRAVVQAPTKKAAAQALGVTVGTLNTYAAVTGNPMEIAAASSKPGAVFWCPISDSFRSDRIYTERPARAQ